MLLYTLEYEKHGKAAWGVNLLIWDLLRLSGPPFRPGLSFQRCLYTAGLRGLFRGTLIFEGRWDCVRGCLRQSGSDSTCCRTWRRRVSFGFAHSYWGLPGDSLPGISIDVIYRGRTLSDRDLSA
jgi:hypothetical protein